MRYLDKTFFKFLVGFSLIIIGGLFFISKVQAQSTLVNINTASLEELQTLNGIGPTIAQRIIDYRTGNGPFVLIEDIKNVNGIGDSIFEKIRNSITVGITSSNAENSQNNSTQNSNQTGTTVTQSSLGASSGPVIKNIEYKIITEKEKFGTAGSPIDFSVKHNVGGNKVPVRWTFGDGSIAYGQNVTHTYEYPGEYVTVISINAIEEKVSARVNVSISEDSIVIIEANTRRVVIQNNGKKEAYLYGKKIVSSDSYFEFPEDMIIRPGQKIALSSQVTGLSISNASAVIRNLNDRHTESETLALNEEERQKVIDQIIVLQNKQIEIKKSKESRLASIGSVVAIEDLATTTVVEKKGFIQKIRAFFRFK